MASGGAGAGGVGGAARSGEGGGGGEGEGGTRADGEGEGGTMAEEGGGEMLPSCWSPARADAAVGKPRPRRPYQPYAHSADVVFERGTLNTPSNSLVSGTSSEASEDGGLGGGDGCGEGGLGEGCGGLGCGGLGEGGVGEGGGGGERDGGGGGCGDPGEGGGGPASHVLHVALQFSRQHAPKLRSVQSCGYVLPRHEHTLSPACPGHRKLVAESTHDAGGAEVGGDTKGGDVEGGDVEGGDTRHAAHPEQKRKVHLALHGCG